MTMITQPPWSTRLWMWTIKWQWWELVCITIHFHIFVCNISIILNMILSIYPFYFTSYFFSFNWSKTPCFRCSLDRFFWNSLARLKSLFCVQELIGIRESNRFHSCNWTLDINWYIYIALVNEIDTIYHLFAVFRFTKVFVTSLYPSINGRIQSL